MDAGTVAVVEMVLPVEMETLGKSRRLSNFSASVGLPPLAQVKTPEAIWLFRKM